MAELNVEEKIVKPSEKEVELDTDDAKEQDVEVKEPEKKVDERDKINLDHGEVDLGYTDHQSKTEEKAKIQVEEIEEPAEVKPTEEKPKEDLGKYTENVQKRIDKLTYRAREAERREQAATQFAKGLQKKYDSSQAKFDKVDESYLKEFDARVDSEREQVKVKLSDAIANQEPTKIMEATDELTKLAVEKEKAKIKLAEHEYKIKQATEKAKTPEQAGDLQAQMPEEFQQPSEKAQAWAQKNDWFGNDRIMSGAAWNVHEDLMSRGVDVESDEYYNQIDGKMREYFPQKFESSTTIQEARKPVQTVASAGRTQQGRRSVRLTKSQVTIAKKLGVPLEEYAKYVKEEA